MKVLFSLLLVLSILSCDKEELQPPIELCVNPISDCNRCFYSVDKTCLKCISNWRERIKWIVRCDVRNATPETICDIINNCR